MEQVGPLLGSHGEMSSPVWEARWSSLARPESVFCMLEQRKAEAKLGQVPEIHSQGKRDTSKETGRKWDSEEKSNKLNSCGCVWLFWPPFKGPTMGLLDNVERNYVAPAPVWWRRGPFSPLCVCDMSLQLCWTLCDPMYYSPPGSSVHGILQQEYWSGLPCPSLGIFLIQGSNLCLLWLLDCRRIFYHHATRRSLSPVYSGQLVLLRTEADKYVAEFHWYKHIFKRSVEKQKKWPEFVWVPPTFR